MRERESRGRGREIERQRERQNLKQVLGSTLSAQNPDVGPELRNCKIVT